MVFLEDSLPYLLLRNNSNRLTIVALELGGSAKVVVRQRLLDGIPARRGEREDALGDGEGLVIRALLVEMDRQIAKDPSQPPRVVEGRRQRLGLAQVRQGASKVARRQER